MGHHPATCEIGHRVLADGLKTRTMAIELSTALANAATHPRGEGSESAPPGEQRGNVPLRAHRMVRQLCLPQRLHPRLFYSWSSWTCVKRSSAARSAELISSLFSMISNKNPTAALRVGELRTFLGFAYGDVGAALGGGNLVDEGRLLSGLLLLALRSVDRRVKAFLKPRRTAGLGSVHWPLLGLNTLKSDRVFIL